MDRERIVVAELVRPRGNRGELMAISQTDVPGRLESLKRCFVRLQDGTDVPVVIEAAWQHDANWVLKFDGVDSISAAERFRRSDVWVPVSERGQLPEGELFRTDLIGCRLLARASGEEIGTVEGWQQFGGPLLIETTVAGREALIPFIPQFCPEVDLARRSIVVDLPDGLLEL